MEVWVEGTVLAVAEVIAEAGSEGWFLGQVQEAW